MKSVLQAGWLLTVAIGNFIVLIVAELAEFPEQVRRNAAAAAAKTDASGCVSDQLVSSSSFPLVGRVRSVRLAPAGCVCYLLRHGPLLQVHRPYLHFHILSHFKAAMTPFDAVQQSSL